MKNGKQEVIVKNRTCALHTNDTGIYTGIREVVVAVVTSYNGEPFDWAAYGGFCLADMDIEQAKSIISKSGDKLYVTEARQLCPQYDDVQYRG